MHKKLKFMVNSDGLDIYQYHGTFFSPFFTGYRGFEKRSIKNTIRMSLLSMVEPYQIYYALDKGEVIGFAVVSSGGGD